MTVYFTHTSALMFWRLHREVGHCAPRPRRIEAYDSSRPSRLEVLDAARTTLPDGAPLHIAIGANQRRCSPYGICLHRWRRLGATTSYVQVAPDVLVASPLLMLVQMGDLIGFEHFVELATELAGTFTRSVRNPGSFCEAPPLLAPEPAMRQLQQNPGAYRARIASRWLRYVLSGAASPREATVSMLLCLPMRYGGYGLPRAELNASIPMTAGEQRRLHRHELRCDMYWPSRKVALEYESDQWHAGAEALARDSKRRNDLRLLGVDVMTLTNQELKDRQELDRLHHVLCRLLGHRDRSAVIEGFSARQRQLRRLLLDKRVRAGAEHLLLADGPLDGPGPAQGTAARAQP